MSILHYVNVIYWEQKKIFCQDLISILPCVNVKLDYWEPLPPKKTLPGFYVDLTFREWKLLRIEEKKTCKDLISILYCVNVNVDYWEFPHPRKKRKVKKKNKRTFQAFYVQLTLSECGLLKTKNKAFLPGFYVHLTFNFVIMWPRTKKKSFRRDFMSILHCLNVN